MVSMTSKMGTDKLCGITALFAWFWSRTNIKMSLDLGPIFVKCPRKSFIILVDDILSFCYELWRCFILGTFKYDVTGALLTRCTFQLSMYFCSIQDIVPCASYRIVKFHIMNKIWFSSVFFIISFCTIIHNPYQLCLGSHITDWSS